MTEGDGGSDFGGYFREIFYAVFFITVGCGIAVLYHPADTDEATIQCDGRFWSHRRVDWW
jgi:hypothetical protein